MGKIQTLWWRPVQGTHAVHAVTPVPGFHWALLPVLAFSAKPLAQICLIVCLALTTACMGLMVTGHVNYSHDQAPSFELTLCDDLPCFRGVIPGKTDWDTALAVFNGQSMIQRDSLYIGIALFPSPDRRTVDTILLNRPLAGAANVGAVLSLYGEPPCVEINRTASTLILHYPNLHVRARFLDNRFNPGSPLLSVVLGQFSKLATGQEPVCSRVNLSVVGAQTSQHVWQGFASMQHYLNGIG